jgi:hypothetical protein
MSPAKTTSERVDKLRKDRAALGLKRKEVYVHDDDWPELLKLAKRLERRRANRSSPTGSTVRPGRVER